MSVQKIKRFLVALLAVCTLLTQGNMVAFATEQEEEPYEGNLYLEFIVPNGPLTVGDQMQCSVNITPVEPEHTITWSIGDESVATIDEKGLLTAVSPGETTLNAELLIEGFDPGYYEWKIKVLPVYAETITLSQTTATLDAGYTLQLSATIAPENVTYQEIEWSSDNQAIAKVDENGLVTALSAGTTNIYATATDGSEVSATCTITVNATDENESGVRFYKNNTFVGTYDTINEAFDMMTDATADYQLVLMDKQVLEGYAQWPKANSIKIMPMLSGEEYGSATILYTTEKKTTFNSDICLSDWVCLMPYVEEGDAAYNEINMQSYEWTFTEELAGHNTTVGYSGAGIYANSGYIIKGDVGSKMTIRNTTQFWCSSIQVDTLEIVHHAQGEGSSAGMTLYYPVADSTINTIIAEYSPVRPIIVRGFTDLKTKFTIGGLQFVEKVMEGNTSRPSFNIHSEGMTDVELKSAPENANISFAYDSKWAVKTGTFSYTGTTAPNSIGVSLGMHSQGGEIGPADKESYAPFEEDYILLYAPNVSSDVISFSYSMQNELGCFVFQTPYFGGKVTSDDGYYHSDDMPFVMPSKVVYVTDEAFTDTLTYTGVNKNGKLHSVTWTAYRTDLTTYKQTDVTAEVIGAYDEDSVDITFSDVDMNEETSLIGTFDYGDGELRVCIPIVSSSSASDVSFVEPEMEVEYDGGYVRRSVELNYSAGEDVEIILTSSDYDLLGHVELSGNTVSFSVKGYGTAYIRAYIGGEVAECKVVITEPKEEIPDGWNQASDGNWYYYKDGEVDTSVNGIVRKDNEYWYAVNGMADFTVTTVAKYGNSWWYVGNGKVDKTYDGVASNANGTYYIENGKVDFTKTGILKRGDKYYLFEKGKVQFKTTIAKKGSSWFYINNGVVDFTYTGVAKQASGKWYYVAKGKVDFTYDGVAPNANGSLYYVENGKVDFTKNGILKRSGKYYYFKDGKVQAKDTIVKHTNGNWYAVFDGVVDFTYDGIASNGKNTYYIENGKVDFAKSGIHKRGGVFYYFKSGKVQFIDTIIKHTNGNWYAVWDGVVDFTFEGIASNDRGMYYCQKGKVNFNYTGTVTYDGHTYKVVKGKATLIE